MTAQIVGDDGFETAPERHVVPSTTIAAAVRGVDPANRWASSGIRLRAPLVVVDGRAEQFRADVH
jgi:hypothetical protein